MFLRKVIYTNIDNLVYDLLNEIGLTIGTDHCLYDMEANNKLNMGGGKNIIATIDSVNQPVYNSEFNIVFDPIGNYKMITMIMGYYFEREKAAGNMYVISYATEEVERKGPVYMRITIQGEHGMEFVTGKPYYNKSLAICDIILRLAGIDPDLSYFDTIEEKK